MSVASERKDEWWRQKRWWIPAVLLAVLIAVDLVVAFGLPDRVIPSVSSKFSQADRLKSVADLRGNILGLLTPVVALIAGIAALLNFQETRLQNERTVETTQGQLEEVRRQNERTFQTSVDQLGLARQQFAESQELQRRGQVTERFAKAIEQLGETEREKVDIRMGAIYSLEQIARDSPDLHWPIVEILTAFIREHTKADADAQPRNGQPERHQQTAAVGTLATDIQAALSVLRRRNSDRDSGRIDLREANLWHAQLQDANLQEVNLSGANLQGANLTNAKLPGANLSGANLSGANLSGANLQIANLMNANLPRAHLTAANLVGTNLFRVNLEGAELNAARLDGVTLIDANLKGASLINATLNSSSLNWANLQGADLSRANLEGAILWMAHARRANFVETNLQGAHLFNADFQVANLDGANLRGAWLNLTDLTNARLKRVNLADAVVERVHLYGANLEGANLQGAKFQQVDLEFAKGLTQEQLDSAICDEATKPAPGLTIKRGDSAGGSYS